MKNSRIWIALVLIAGVVVVILATTSVQRLLATRPSGTNTPLPPGSIPIYLNQKFMGAFTPDFLNSMPTLQFTDVYEEKPQDGWALSKVILLVVPERQLDPQSVVVVTSSSRDKSAKLTWAEVKDPANYVMFDLSNRGTLKLVSVLPALDGRNEWVQDVDRIDITGP
jgi:hypothetical protein